MDKNKMKERKKIILDLIEDKHYIPMKIKEIAIVLNIPKEKRAELTEVLNELMIEGRITLSKRGKYSLAPTTTSRNNNDNKADSDAIIGVFEANARGFGFVAVEGEEDDIFIPESGVHGAMHKDTVQVNIKVNAKDGKRREGEIVKIVERGTSEVVGYYQKSKNFGFVICDNQRFDKDIFIPLERSKGAVTGHKVVVKITDYGSKDKKPEGIVTEIIGHVNDPGTDIMSIVKGYEIPTDFPPEVMKQIEKIPDVVDPADFKDRMDIRDWQMVTIDGEDAKDLDDAITVTKNDTLYQLGVHIADVSNYVTENSPLDKEAIKRGTSVYLVDRVIPMLPHKLSNGICSLNEGVDRLALSCIMDIDSTGKVIGHKIAKTIVKIDRRMSYTSVKKILADHDEAEINEYKELVPMFELMNELAAILKEKRRQRGSIDFDFPESKIILDDNGKPIDIKPYDRNVATKIIEDFMLIANETIAEDYFWQEIPFVYRTHDTPDSEKMIKLGTFINNFGYEIKMGQGEIHPKEIQKLLCNIEGTEEEPLISRLTLRSMKQAKYTIGNAGHFGLSTKYYCHFTSPIRRYPDLQIHRIIKENLSGGLSEKRRKHYESILSGIADQSSKTERRADEAERDTDKLKKVEYMEQFIGEEFDGVISSITSWGMYVELPNTVEGMIHVTALKGDYYAYHEEHYEMVGEATGKRYKLGQKVKVRVMSTDKLLRTIDFELVENSENCDDKDVSEVERNN